MRRVIALAIPALFLMGCLDPAAQAEKVKRTADGKETSASSSAQAQTQAAEIILTVVPPEAPEKPQPPLPPVTPQQPVKVQYPGGSAEVPVGSKVTLRAGSSSTSQQSESVTSEQVWKAVRAIPQPVLYAGILLITVGFIVAALVRGLRLTGLAISLGGIVGMGSVILLYQFGETIAYCIGGGILFLAVVGGAIAWYLVRQHTKASELALEFQESSVKYQKAFTQTIAGVQKFAEKNDPSVVDNLKSCIGRKQDEDVQLLVKATK